jgi:predicted AAA+ superfamily ATPase
VFERAITSRLKTRRSVLLLGPRQVGKSTLLSSLKPDITINLASPAVFRDYVSRPERLESELRGAGAKTRTVFIDEVQRVPALLDAVQVLLDEAPRKLRFLLSGSSARKLRRGHANLLPGRIHVHHLHPLLACELGPRFDLDRVLAHGTLPGIYAETETRVRAADLRAYADVYLREEIQAEALVRDVGGYSRLLELVAASSGRIINLRALSTQSGVSYETARRYMSVLEDTLVAFTVPAWSGSDRATLLAHPKIYLFDLGVRNALLLRPLNRPAPDEIGLLLEHLVAYEIHRRQGTLWPEARLFHYRTRHRVEVDFVLQVGGDLWGIEVKAARDISSRDCAALDSLAESVRGVSRRIIIFLGPRRQALKRVEAIPLLEFLAELPS